MKVKENLSDSDESEKGLLQKVSLKLQNQYKELGLLLCNARVK